MKKISAVVCLLFFLFCQNAFGQCDLDFRYSILNDSFANTANKYRSDYFWSVCKGSAVTFIADSITQATYQWYLDDVPIQGATKKQFEIKEKSGKYSVQAMSGGCIYSVYANIDFTSNINSLLTSNVFERLGETICSSNGVAILNAYHNLLGNVKYQWQKDGVDIQGIGTSNYQYYPSQKGIYTVRISQGACETTSLPVEIKMATLNSTAAVVAGNIISKDSTFEYCKGLIINFSVDTIPPFPTDVQVYKDDKPINIINSNNLPIRVTESGKYRLEYKNGDCLIKSPNITFNLGNKLHTFPIVVDSSTFNGCSTKLLRLTNEFNYILALGSPLTVEWRQNGVKLSSGPEPSYYYASKTGIYTAVLSIGTCQKESEKFVLNSLKPTPIKLGKLNSELRLILRGGKKVELCAGTKVEIFVPYPSELFKDGKPANLTLNPQYNLEISETGKYYLIHNNGNGCIEYSDTLEVVVKPKISKSITLDNTQCQNGIFKLSADKADGLVYAWKKDGVLIPNANVSTFSTKEAGNYSVVINQGYCSVESQQIAVGAKIFVNSVTCEGQKLQFSANTATSYEWTGPNNFTSKIQNPSIDKLTTANNGWYFLKATNDVGCVFKDSVNINVNPNPVFTVQVPDIICLGKSFTINFNSSNNNLSYHIISPDNNDYYTNSYFGWVRDNVSQSMAGNYKITATDTKSQCQTNITQNVVINTTADCPSITLSDLSKTQFCYNGEYEIPFTVSGKFDPNVKFTLNYKNNDGSLQPLATVTKSPFKVKINFFGRVIITSNDRNISSSLSAYLNINNPSTPSIQYSSLYACTGYQVDLKVDTTYAKFNSFQWKLNGRKIERATKSTYSAGENGNYTVEAIQNGCLVNSYNIGVTIGKLQKPSISYDSKTHSMYICAGDTLTLTSYNYPKDASFQWNLEDKSLDKATAAFTKATKTGAYSLTVKQGTCEATSAQLQINVGDIIPNAISSYSNYSSDYNPTEIETCKGQAFMLYYPFYAMPQESIEYTKSLNTNAHKNGFRFQWQKDGSDVANTDSSFYTIAGEGIYRLKITQGNCIAYSKPVQIKFRNKVKLRLYSSSSANDDNNNTFACSGDTIRLYFYGNNRYYYNFPAQLYKDDKIYKELPKNTQNADVFNSGSYWVKQNYPIAGTQEVCVATSDTVNVKIGGNKIEVSRDNISTCLDTVSLYSYYNNTAKYRWKLNDNYLPNDTLLSLKAYQSGTYQWESDISKTCQFVSKPFNLTFGKLEATLESPYKTIPCYGEITTLYPSIKSRLTDNDGAAYYVEPLLTYQWQKDGVNFSTNSGIDVVQKGTYSVTIKQGKCSVTTNPVTIDFLKIPRDISPKDSVGICANGSFVDLVSSADASYKYAWLKDNKLLANQTKQTLRASDFGSYQTQIESGDCATLSYPVKVYQSKILPTAVISGSKSINFGDSTSVKIDLTSSPPWTVKLTNGTNISTEKTPYSFSVKPTESTTYELASVKNGCGDGTITGKAEIKIIILGNEEITNAKIKLYPIPTDDVCVLEVQTFQPSNLMIKLIDLNGKIIFDKKSDGKLFQHNENLSMRNLPSGIYLLSLDVDGKIIHRKIIKN